MQSPVKKIGTITLESFSIFNYGVNSQKYQRCLPIICVKEKRTEKANHFTESRSFY